MDTTDPLINSSTMYDWHSLAKLTNDWFANSTFMLKTSAFVLKTTGKYVHQQEWIITFVIFQLHSIEMNDSNV